MAARGRKALYTARLQRSPPSRALITLSIFVLGQWALAARHQATTLAAGGADKSLLGYPDRQSGLGPDTECATIRRIAIVGERHTGEGGC